LTPATHYYVEGCGWPRRVFRDYHAARSVFDTLLRRKAAWARIIEENDLGYRREVASYQRRTR
jgi:hypothetical protein